MLGSLLVSIFIVLNAVFLFLSYRFQNIKMMVTSRIINYILTIALFGILLSDSHVFEDSNVLQMVEKRMIDEAKVEEK